MRALPVLASLLALALAPPARAATVSFDWVPDQDRSVPTASYVAAPGEENHLTLTLGASGTRSSPTPCDSARSAPQSCSDFSARNSSIPYGPSSRPCPDCL